MVLVPVFIWLTFISRGNTAMLWATFIFIAASITDYYDGLLARKYHVISDFGKIMDPLADKLLVIAAILVLALKLNYISRIAVYIIIFREVVVSILREIFAARQIFIPANIWGKIKTVMQMFGITLALILNSLIIIFPDLDGFRLYIIRGINIFFWTIVFFTIFSGLIYFVSLLRKKF